MELKDLYDLIDWSSADIAHDKWAEKEGAEKHEISDFKRDFRMSLLAYSLPKEMANVEDWTLGKMNDARYALYTAGVWSQITALLVAHKLIGEKDGNDN